MEKKYFHPGGKFRRLGPSACSEKELLTIIINAGTKNLTAEKIAERILDKYGNIYNISGKTLKELMEIEGIGPIKATQLAAMFELTKRILRHIESE
ncbi:MAG: hypothetical protein NTX22_00885 [Ignavibacteriales bacterium]|nr:hypothetical protein [Ignavibacteriales bacterium]